MTPETETTDGFTTGLRQELEALQSDVARMTGEVSKNLTQALIEGRELDQLLQKLVLQQADKALSSAMSDAYGLVGSVGEGLANAALGAAGGAAANIFNVSVATQDLSSFRQSETQLAASLSRAVSRGQRGL